MFVDVNYIRDNDVADDDEVRSDINEVSSDGDDNDNDDSTR